MPTAPANATGKVVNGQAFPVAGGSGKFSDTWGAARSGGRKHEGTDILAPRGTPVVAMVAGTVEKIGSVNLGGNRVGIRGTDGRYYYYAHLDTYAAGLKQGDQVQAGQQLGTVGDTGNAKGTPHLHFGIYENGQAINPYPTLKGLQG